MYGRRLNLVRPPFGSFKLLVGRILSGINLLPGIGLQDVGDLRLPLVQILQGLKKVKCLKTEIG
jgi:hypothetical protein